MRHRLTRENARAKGEPTIALINIVFLMLIFFLIAGTLAAPIDRDLSLVKLSDLEGTPPPDALLVFPDGRLSFRGESTDLDAHVAMRRDDVRDAETATPLSIRLVPDQDLPAKDLIDLANDLKSKGAEKVVIVMERTNP